MGGVGLIITEGTCINHPGAHGYPNVPSFYGNDALEGWRQVVNAVHTAGGKIVPQLWHVGSVRKKGQPPIPHADSYAPTGGIIHPYLLQNAQSCHEISAPIQMQQNDIDDVISAYVQAAVDAKKLGFDGIELHGAHSYLIDQFFWEYTNKRHDKYGGNLQQRTRFACEIIQEIRRAVGSEFPIIFRFSQWKFTDFQHKMATTPSELELFLTPLADAGVDIFHCSTHQYYQPEFPDDDPQLNLAGWTKKIIALPTITVGSVGISHSFKEDTKGTTSGSMELDDVLERLEQEEFDLIAFGRTLIADSALANKLQSGRFDDIVSFKQSMLSDYD